MKQFRLTWEAPIDDGGSPINDYVIQYRISGDSTWITYTDSISTDTSGVILSGFTECEAYEFRVAASNSIGTGSFSSTIAKGLSFAPGNITDLQVQQNEAYINGSWVAPSDNGGCNITDYIIEYNASNNSNWIMINDDVSTDTSFSISGLSDNTYTFKVTPVNIGGYGQSTESSSIVYSQPDPDFANVVTLLNMDGVNGSTTFNDSSSLVNTSTANNVSLSTDIFKYGTSSGAFGFGYLDGFSSVDLSSGSYTVEGWFYTENNNQGDNMNFLAGNFANYPDRWILDIGVSEGFAYPRVVTPYNETIATYNAPYVLGTWAHVAWVNDTSQNTFSVYWNGTRVGQRSAVSLAKYSTMQIGKGGSSYIATAYYLDDIRITKSVRYSGATFNVPSAAHPTCCISTTTTTTTTTIEPVEDQYFSNVSMLMHMDGSNNGTTFTDSSANSTTLIRNGASVTSNVESKFGGSSLYLDGSSSLSAGSATPFSFGTDDFTIEAWIYPTSLASLYSPILEARNNATYNSYVFGIYGSALDFTPGGDYGSTRLQGTTAIQTNIWTHVAVTRQAGLCRLFINGVLQNNTATFSSNINCERSSPLIGQLVDPYYYTGYIDELRITKGVARYTSNFSVPVSEFPTCCTTTSTTPDPSLTPTITVQPSHNYSTSYSDSVAFSVVTTGPSNMTYQWQAWSLNINTYEYMWQNLPGKISASTTISGQDIDNISGGDSSYTRDIKLRCVISSSGFADTITQSVFLDKIYGSSGYVDLYDSNYNTPTSSETVGGVSYQVLSGAISPVSLSMYEMGFYGSDLSWFTGNDISIYIEQSTDATNWSEVVTRSVRGYISLAENIPQGSGSVYYRIRIVFNWPYSTTNNTVSATKSAYTVPYGNWWSSTFKIIWS